MKQQHTSVINKPHFEVLDGLRGVAAIAVVIFHFMEIAVPDPWIIVVGTVLLLLLAYLVMKFIDDPIRKWLNK